MNNLKSKKVIVLEYLNKNPDEYVRLDNNPDIKIKRDELQDITDKLNNEGYILKQSVYEYRGVLTFGGESIETPIKAKILDYGMEYLNNNYISIFSYKYNKRNFYVSLFVLIFSICLALFSDDLNHLIKLLFNNN